MPRRSPCDIGDHDCRPPVCCRARRRKPVAAVVAAPPRTRKRRPSATRQPPGRGRRDCQLNRRSPHRPDGSPAREWGWKQSGNYVWSDNGEKLEIDYRGEIEFTDDDTDVARMSPGGMLRIREGRRWLARTPSSSRRTASGNIQRRFWVGWTERRSTGRPKWLATMLPRFIRQSGSARRRGSRGSYKSGGVTGVLARDSLIEGSWAKRVYFTELMKSPGLSAADVQRAFAQAGAEMDSDFELASFLIASNRLIADDGTRRAYLEAAQIIGVGLSSCVGSFVRAQGGAGRPRRLPPACSRPARRIDSDFEEASLLMQFARQQPLDATVRGPFFKALATVGSAFEHSRVLQTVLAAHRPVSRRRAPRAGVGRRDRFGFRERDACSCSS